MRPHRDHARRADPRARHDGRAAAGGGGRRRRGSRRSSSSSPAENAVARAGRGRWAMPEVAWRVACPRTGPDAVTPLAGATAVAHGAGRGRTMASQRDCRALASSLRRVPCGAARARGGPRARSARASRPRAVGAVFWALLFACSTGCSVYFRGAEGSATCSRQAARADPDRLLLDPAAVEHHHRAVDVLPGARSRPARGRAGRRLRLYVREAARDARRTRAGWSCCVRCRCSRAFGWRLRRRRGVRRCVALATIARLPRPAGGGRARRSRCAGQRVSGATHARHPRAVAVLGAAGLVVAVPAPAPGAARAAGGVPHPRRLRGRAAHAEVAVAAERVGGGGDHGRARRRR